ncbi:uncharacterized protein MONBRDRAFT_23668 [Monosiga brevicollis MX1]|uniref:PABS domain-containing protein n=1 Tax=Monosiga brevicollis TaxID=81824 RepID=A9UU43_MONBE|nr:uncharacterized protein MONBRDRAFT_23668 [Monosiga brevicollis MX1]EDQ91603.1 predicted protein [Monosiga brevicollis MX1]|eukprot:XP_001744025.1 hypothetical protein [Monosiga brevicollis MX1]
MVDRLAKGWFSEVSSEMWPGQAMSLAYEEILEDVQSDFQHVQILKTKTYGNALCLDGVIQITERDEFSYQEMMVHVPMFSHPNPEHVLIIGGGDGGVLREVLKHPALKSVTQCEIDGTVIELCKKHLPSIAQSFHHPKANVIVGDGFEYMKQHQQEFDVIITDSSDPIGPASSLFEKEYYSLVRSALRDGGIMCAQGECIWLHLDLIKSMQEFSRTLYPVVDYGYLTIPTYPSGQIGFILCSKNSETNFRVPLRRASSEDMRNMHLRYYNPDIHSASFVLPQFARLALEEAEASTTSASA